MKKVFSNIFSTFLAVLVLFSTFSFTVEKHYCMGELADYSFVGNVDRCEMFGEVNYNPDETSYKKIPCCDDVVQIIEGTNAELKIAKELSFDTFQFLAVFYTSYIKLFERLQDNVIPFKNHSPPLLTKDIQALYETYLI